MKRVNYFPLVLLLVGIIFYGPYMLSGPAPVKLKLISPNGGEILRKGVPFQIKWSSADPKGSIVLVLYKNGIKHSVITRKAPNKGIFRWRVPGNLPDGKDYRIRIRLADNLAVNDFSDRDFKIKK